MVVKGERYAIRFVRYPQTVSDYKEDGIARAKAILALPWLERAAVLQRLKATCSLTHKATLRAMVDIDLMAKLTGVAL